jgi:hypothetical protein
VFKKMMVSEPKKTEQGFVLDVFYNGGEYYFTSQSFSTLKDAKRWGKDWCYWANNVSTGSVESIYYIVQIPDNWAGPLCNQHPYSGLFIKIGRSKNVLKRLANLQTGTYGQLVINALEPGNSNVEAKLHRKFASLRRQGEWFSCTKELFQHVFDTWYKNKMLPPIHQEKIQVLAQRIGDYRLMRKLVDKPIDIVNPSLEEEWGGTVFIDLVYSSLAKTLK